MKKLVCVVAFFMAPGAAMAATETGDLVELNVRFDRAALETVEGAEEVYDAIVAQIKDACSTRTWSGKYVDQSCVEDMLSSAIEQIGDEKLSIIAEVKS